MRKKILQKLRKNINIFFFLKKVGNVVGCILECNLQYVPSAKLKSVDQKLRTLWKKVSDIRINLILFFKLSPSTNSFLMRNRLKPWRSFTCFWIIRMSHLKAWNKKFSNVRAAPFNSKFFPKLTIPISAIGK